MKDFRTKKQRLTKKGSLTMLEIFLTIGVLAYFAWYILQAITYII